MCIPCTRTDWPFIQATLHISITFHIEFTALSPNNRTQCSYQYNKAGQNSATQLIDTHCRSKQEAKLIKELSSLLPINFMMTVYRILLLDIAMWPQHECDSVQYMQGLSSQLYKSQFPFRYVLFASPHVVCSLTLSLSHLGCRVWRDGSPIPQRSPFDRCSSSLTR